MSAKKTTKKKVVPKAKVPATQPAPTPTTPIQPPNPIAVLILRQNPRGRPTDMTIATVSNLLNAFNNDYNITQACAYAGISRETYYAWSQKFPYFSDKMQEARDMPIRRSKEVVIGAINEGDANLAFRLLERRDPDYKPRAELENNLGVQQTQDKLKEFFDGRSPSDDEGGKPTAADDADGSGGVPLPPTDIS